MAENTLESIATCLERSLSPQYARIAEQQLKDIEMLPEFSVNLLKIISAAQVNNSIRLSAVIFLKNLIKRKWVNENGDHLLPVSDVEYLKTEMLNVMVNLPNNLQVQIGECIAIIAESDFPHRWGSLIDDLISRFSTSDFKTNKSILLVSHSIFKKWRPLFRSDELFMEIKLVLDNFAEPFLMLLTKIDELIDTSLAQRDQANLKIYLDNLLLLIQIYYDLNCQDIPEFFEDNMMNGMKIMHKYLNFSSDLITDADDDEEVDVIIKIKTSVIELVNLYITRYTEIFEPLIENFIKIVWELITTSITKQQKFDLLIVKCLQFLTLIIKLSNYQNIFNNEDSLNEILKKIILPNIYLREVDLEMFEDEPINFVRFDVEGSEFDSRRKSATDFLRELKEINNELLTDIVMRYVNNFLENSNDKANWQSKDLAIYLFSSLAAKGSVTNIGVTSTNVLVDVVKFFSENISNYLLAANTASIHPILITDSVKYILIFRNQLTKEQLLSVLPLLVSHLTNPNPVIYTYAAIVMEKLLSMTSFAEAHEVILNKFDLQPYLNDILSNLFKLITSSYDKPPEKLSENEFLVKSIMRVLNTSEDLVPFDFKKVIITQLLDILAKISKNPANPKFSHYIFESLGLLVKFSSDDKVNELIVLILPNLLNILNEDVQEFVPYTFQVLAYMLERLPGNESSNLPSEYTQLIKPLMSPNLWQFRGNIPGITRLLISIIKYDYKVFSTHETVTPLLGIFQKLIASKLNEVYGFELLETILLYIPLRVLEKFLKSIAVLILTRLKNSRTEKFLKRFITFVFSISSLPLNKSLNIRNPGLNANFIITLINLPQPGVFEQILSNLVLPNLSSFQNLRDKKINLIGLSQLVNSDLINSTLKIILLEQIAKSSTSLMSLNKDVIANADDLKNVALSELDLDVGSFGSNFSKLVTIQVEPFDPLSEIKNNDLNHIKQIVSNGVKLVDGSIVSQISLESQNALQVLL
ncbi:importin-alpha export receptor [Yamadazyma tenuis]|uniref:Cse1-domain-containing protein n=1 Tax=Candida tenuis (strain ATCC 10573 / BCRC 21748 / CBS 615 / JCM 9827 / NBRC 10315 / NRRL Y-1498 / VKM Y-70) TaxID=590646 RepID=G3BE05_CANTC|nr:Cse1-domain-containing protein [Yamadazyma tenuis ATCC 10573]EGV60425.1 Cse1-domain-containing protein [Yamadazyma tenuis ATCC 10573]WEJ94330.1 importin-alpha export receptor [Yamadazyma tenuis]